MRDFHELGIRANSSVEDDTVRGVESKLGCSFPKSYLALIRHNDEPEPEIGVFTYESGETCISEFFRFTDDETYEYGILWYSRAVGGLPHCVVPIARDAGDFLICLDLREGERVVLFDTDSNQLIFVCASFEEFLDSLNEG